MSDPISVFHQAARAIEDEAWEEAVSLCDPATLSLFKRELLARVESEPQLWTAERMVRIQPDLPMEVAEYQAAKLAKCADPQWILWNEVPGVSSVDQLRELTPAAAFAAWLDGQSYSRQLERAKRDANLPPEVVENALQRPFKTTYEVLGAVQDGERLVHVIFRRKYESPEPDELNHEAAEASPGLPGLSDEEISVLKDQRASSLDFATLRRQPDGSWRLLAGHAFLGRNNPVFVFGYDEDEPDD